jgi:hypothetical protein
MRRKLSREELIKAPERSAKMAQFNIGRDPPPRGGKEHPRLEVI